MRRQVIPELLDTDSGTADQIAESISDLRRINQWFGGVSTTLSMIECVLRESATEAFSLLEVASAAGDVPRQASKRLMQNGIRLEVTLLDRASSHLKSHMNRARAVAGDALALPFADGSFDLVSCCLFVHHLGPEELMRFVNDALRVCRVAVLINDLIRHPLHLALVYAGLPLYRSRLTRHDAPASVRAAYTPQEMLDIVQRTNVAKIQVQRHYLFRMGVVLWK